MSKYSSGTTLAAKIAAGLAVLLAASAVCTCGIIFGGWFQSADGADSADSTSNVTSSADSAEENAAVVSILEDTGDEVWNCILIDGADVQGWLFGSADGAATTDYTASVSYDDEDTYSVTGITFELNADSAIYTTYAALFTVTSSTVTMYDGAFQCTFADVVQAFFGTTDFSTDQLAALQALADSEEGTFKVTVTFTADTSGAEYAISNEYYLYPVTLLYQDEEDSSSETSDGNGEASGEQLTED